MPPVREASTKPSAATVLPAPVACSNQKRRLASGSSGGLGDRVLRLRVDRLLVPVLRLLVLLEGILLGDGGATVAIAAVTTIAGARTSRSTVGTVADVGAGLLDLGDDRRERSRQRVDLVFGELGAVEQQRPLLGEHALEAEQQ